MQNRVNVPMQGVLSARFSGATGEKPGSLNAELTAAFQGCIRLSARVHLIHCEATTLDAASASRTIRSTS